MYDAFTGDGNDSVVRAYEEFPLLMPRWGYVASAFVLFLIGFFGFFLNLLVILLMFKDRQLWTPINMILFNLVCADLSVSVLGNPLTLLSALSHRWLFGRRMCVLYGFFMALLGITSITTLTVLAFERYMLVTRPFSRRHLTPRGASLTVLFIWSYALAVTTPPLFGWGNYVNEAANISCSVNWQEQTFNTLTYILFMFAMGQVIPCGVIGFSYYNIVRTMKENSLRMGRRVNRAEAKVTAMVFVMIVAFMVAWTPYSVLALLEQFADHGMVSPGVGVIPALVAKSSICYDPLIYVGMNTQFRMSIKRLFGIHSKGSDVNGERGFDNTVMSPAPRMSQYNDDNIVLNDTDNKKSKVDKNTFNSKGKGITIVDGPREGFRKEKSPYNLYATADGETVSEPKCTLDNKSSNSTESVRDEDKESKYIALPEIKPTKQIGDRITTRKICGHNVVMKAHGDLFNDSNVYNNRAFEYISTDLSGNSHNTETEEVTRIHRSSKMKHSTSLEITRVRLDLDARKMSVPSTYETLKKTNRSRSIRSLVVSHFMDRNSEDNFESFNTLLFIKDDLDNDEDSL